MQEKMLSMCLSLVFLLSAPSSRAETEHLRHFNHPYREFLGWSKDSRYAVWYEPIFNPHETEPNNRADDVAPVGERCAIHLAWVLDTRRGSMTRYLIDRSIATRQREYYHESLDRWPMKSPVECENPTPEEPGGRTESSVGLRAQYPNVIEKYRKAYSQVPGPAVLRRLLGGSPLHNHSSRNSPDGTLKLAVEISSKRNVPQRWEDSTLKVGKLSIGENPIIYGAVLRFVVQRGEQSVASLFVPISDDRLMGNAWNGFTPVWAPDGRHLAIVYTTSYHIKRDTYEIGTAIMPAQGPKIALESTTAALARARESIGETLHAAGHSLLSAEAVPQNQLAARTQILWIDQYESAARSLADLLPGGAELKKQSARTSFHLTIKLGLDASRQAPLLGK